MKLHPLAPRYSPSKITQHMKSSETEVIEAKDRFDETTNDLFHLITARSAPNTRSLNRLLEGNKRYVANKSQHPHSDPIWKESLTEGQDPFAIVLSCADSRVVPELVFDCGIGDLFVLRVAGNIATNSTIASIEYAVANLHVNLILVLSHEGCGAITAALENNGQTENLSKLLQYIQPAINASQEKTVEEVAKLNSKNSVLSMLNHSLLIYDAVKEEELQIVPAYYSLTTGKVEVLI